MKLLHTADWHIGQTFHEYDRTFEHEQFLIWLIEAIKTNIDGAVNVIDAALDAGVAPSGSRA